MGTNPNSIRSTAVLALAALLGSAAGARQDPPLVFLQEGELPLILSSPHGGAREIPGVPPRKGEGMKKGPTGFVVARDTGLEELAHDLAAAIRERTGKKPYVVVASFHRRHLDCNRPPEFAYEHDGAKAVYEEYYGALRRYGAEAVRKYGGGLVVDLHGQGTAADRVFRGTQNGQTTTLLQERFGRGLQVGPDSLMGRLKARGWTVHPDGEGAEAAGFSGGHIVRTFGRREAGTDAVQLEFGMDYRREGKRKATAAVLAEVLEEIAKLYAGGKKP
jgi:N-formylglutamate amidohydrolase